MAVFPNRKEYGMWMNPFFQQPQTKDVMGYALSNVADGDTVLPGTPIKTNETNKSAVVCKYAVVTAFATDKKTITVKNVGWLAAGDKIALSGEETLTSLTIASVDKDKSQIVLSATTELTIKEGSVLVEVKETTIPPAQEGDDPTVVVSVKDIPNRIVDTVAKIDGYDNTVSAVHQAVVLQNVIHYPAEWLNTSDFPGSILLAGCPLILFTIQ